MPAKETYVLISSAGPLRDLSKGSREQPFWDDHAAFIDKLDDEGFILLGGPFEEEGGALLVVHASDEHEVRETMKNDPWYIKGVIKMETIKHWSIFIDNRG